MYRKDSTELLKHSDFILLDMICLQVAFILAYAARGHGFGLYSLPLYRSMGLYLELADLVVIFAYGTMKNVLRQGHYRNFLITLRHSLIVGMLALAYLFLTQQGERFSRMTMVLTIVFYMILSYVARELWKRFIRKKMKQGGAKKLLIVTGAEMAPQVIANMQENNYAQYSIAGVALMEGMVEKEISGVPVVSGGDKVPEYICKAWVDEVLLVLPEDAPYPTKLIERLKQTGVTVHYTLGGLTNIAGQRQAIEKVGDYVVVTTSINFATSFQLVLKRMVDIVGGLAGCLVTVVLFLFIAPMTYIASPGPIFFAQERVGKNGKIFKMYKFRSMYMDAEARKAELMKDNKLGDGKMFKLDFDPRVIGNKILPDGTHKTGIGDFIRRTSLDEFPQFFNVLKGEMSIVGTRPPLISETALYEPHHRVRLAIKPGITGMWQVSGRSDITDFEEVVRLDKQYIENWSIGMDIKILLKTVLVVLKRDGSV